ncbi:MAG: sporulation protein YtxC [Bacillus sp. (in: firmicutes)]
MLQIHFESNQQALRMMHIVSEQADHKQLLSNIQYEHSDTIFLIMEDHEMTSMLHMMHEVFVIFTRKELLPQWLLKMVREKFLFSDMEECTQIVDLALTMMQEDNEKNNAFWNNLELRIFHGLVSIFERRISFSLPSFLTFRMKGVLDSLLIFVEAAIDEYKMEQEYQSFIHTLRGYMLSIPAKMEHLHLFHEHHFQFYNASFAEMKRDEIKRCIDRKLFSDYPMYIDSQVLAPLISIAPRHLWVYSEEEEAPLIQTIIRIFEERVSILSHECFSKHKVKM